MTILKDDEYCYISDPVDKNGTNQLGKKILRQGPCSFFVKPGESIDGGIKKIYILTEDEALLLKATEDFSKFCYYLCFKFKDIFPFSNFQFVLSVLVYHGLIFSLIKDYTQD